MAIIEAKEFSRWHYPPVEIGELGVEIGRRFELTVPAGRLLVKGGDAGLSRDYLMCVVIPPRHRLSGAILNIPQLDPATSVNDRTLELRAGVLKESAAELFTDGDECWLKEWKQNNTFMHASPTNNTYMTYDTPDERTVFAISVAEDATDAMDADVTIRGIVRYFLDEV